VEDHQNLALKLSSARLLRSRPRAAPRFHMVGLGGEQGCGERGCEFSGGWKAVARLLS
jgi:hypothetical protein